MNVTNETDEKVQRDEQEMENNERKEAEYNGDEPHPDDESHGTFQ
jgi:hypothetical protein